MHLKNPLPGHNWGVHTLKEAPFQMLINPNQLQRPQKLFSQEQTGIQWNVQTEANASLNLLFVGWHLQHITQSFSQMLIHPKGHCQLKKSTPNHNARILKIPKRISRNGIIVKQSDGAGYPWQRQGKIQRDRKSTRLNSSHT